MTWLDRRWALALLVLAEFLVLASFTKSEITFGGNESARLATAQMLVEHGSFAIDDSVFDSVDRVVIDGRSYSNKPLLLSLWLAGLYAPLHALWGLDFQNARNFLIETLTLFGIATFSVGLTILFQARLRARGMPAASACALGLAVVFSTWIWSFGTTVNNHTPGAALLFAFLMLIERQERDPTPMGAIAAGIVVGLLVCIVIPVGGVFFLVGLAVLGGVRPLPRRAIGFYAVGVAVAPAALAVVNTLAYGVPLDAYWIPGAFDFPESANAPGLAGLRQPVSAFGYLFHMSFGLRGVFSHMPALILGLGLLTSRWRTLGSVERWSAAGVLVLFAFYGTQTGIFGGWAYGFRLLIPVIPVLFWWTSLWWLESTTRGRTGLLVAAVGIGLFSSWVGTRNPWPVAFEGAATEPTAVEYYVRSPLASNLMVWSFERDPEGPLFRWLASPYTTQIAGSYLATEFSNRRQPDLVARAERWLEDQTPSRAQRGEGSL